MNFSDAIYIGYASYERDASRRAALFEASGRMCERARATIAAAKLCSLDGDFHKITMRAAHQLDCANRLQTWAENHARRGAL